MITQAKLDFWIKNNLNVLFIGKHGVGKTSIITSAFTEHNLKWMYFSASTMDPWVDFIGVPREQKDINGNVYLDLVRPKAFQDDQVEALFFDEYNRSPKKVRNSVMELIQFKSINGKKFNNLKIVWAAINPEDKDESDEGDEKYDVEKLDPAQKDRFHVHFYLPYKPYVPYFKQRYGEANTTAAIGWWNELDNKIKQQISPRRLDYALQIFTQGGDVRDTLPNSSNVSKLLHELKNGPITIQLNTLLQNKNTDEAKKFLEVENNYHMSEKIIINNDEMIKFFMPLLNTEKVSNLINSYPKIRNHYLSDVHKHADLLREIINANLNPKLVRIITRAFKDAHVPIVPIVVNTTNAGVTTSNNGSFEDLVKQAPSMIASTYQTADRRRILESIIYKYTPGNSILTPEQIFNIFDSFCNRSQYGSVSNYLSHNQKIKKILKLLKQDFVNLSAIKNPCWVFSNIIKQDL